MLFEMKYGQTIKDTPDSIGTMRTAFLPYIKKPSPMAPNNIESINLVRSISVDVTAVRLGRPEIYGTGVLPDDGLRPEDYRPIHFDEIAALMKCKSFRPVDHHGRE